MTITDQDIRELVLEPRCRVLDGADALAHLHELREIADVTDEPERRLFE